MQSRVHETWREPARDIPIVGAYDVIVAGGGPAGCAAAVTSAREGARTLLVEQQGFLGGAATAGLICRFMSTNGRDFQGVWHDFVRAVRLLDGLRVATEDTLHGAFDPEAIKFAWDDLLNDAGAEVLHHGLVAGCMLRETTVEGVLVETRAGRIAFRAARAIDCTGDGHVAAQAGAEFDVGVDGKPWAMACTLAGRLANLKYPEGMDKRKFRRQIQQAARKAADEGRYTASSIVHGRVSRKAQTWPMRALPHGELTLGGMRTLRVDPLDPFAITRAEREARKELLQQADFYRSCVPGSEDCYLVQTADQIGVRSSRRIRGIETLTEADVLTFRKRNDGIARGSWSVDVWSAEDYSSPTIDKESPEGRAWQDRVAAGDYYDIPYGALVPRKVTNLLAAGRCLSAEHRAQASARIQQTCMATGEAAGLAAALSLREKTPPAALPASVIAEELRRIRSKIVPVFEGLTAV